jgi:hypothetical protein
VRGIARFSGATERRRSEFLGGETDRVETMMSKEQILEAVGYLSWATCFGVLGIGLAAAVVSYRRWLHRQPPDRSQPHS